MPSSSAIAAADEGESRSERLYERDISFELLLPVALEVGSGEVGASGVAAPGSLPEPAEPWSSSASIAFTTSVHPASLTPLADREGLWIGEVGPRLGTGGGGSNPLSLLRLGFRLGEGTIRFLGLGEAEEAGELTTKVGGGGLSKPRGMGERDAALANGELADLMSY